MKKLKFFDIQKFCACPKPNVTIKKPNVSQKIRYSEYVRTAKTKQTTTIVRPTPFFQYTTASF